MPVYKRITRASITILAVAAVFFAVGRFRTSRLQERVVELERERTELSDFVRRLSTTRRVAQIDVLDRRIDKTGELRTRLRWQEIRPDGVLSSPREIEVHGELVYVEAMVLKFEFPFVARGDPDRGYTLALFRRIFGDRQAPETGAPLLSLRSLGEGIASLVPPSGPLWSQFWDMVRDPSAAAGNGVRAAQCEAVAAPLEPGQVWTVTLDAAGGLNLKRIEDRGP